MQKAALQGAGGGKAFCQPVALVIAKALESDDVFAVSLFHVDQTALDCLAVHDDRAASALALRRASVLGGGDAQFLAQGRQQSRVLGTDGGWFAVDGEVGCALLGNCH